MKFKTFRILTFILSLILFLFFAGYGVVEEVFYAGVTNATFHGVALTGLAMMLLQCGGSLNE